MEVPQRTYAEWIEERESHQRFVSDRRGQEKVRPFSRNVEQPVDVAGSDDRDQDTQGSTSRLPPLSSPSTDRDHGKTGALMPEHLADKAMSRDMRGFCGNSPPRDRDRDLAAGETRRQVAAASDCRRQHAVPSKFSEALCRARFALRATCMSSPDVTILSPRESLEQSRGRAAAGQVSRPMHNAHGPPPAV